METKIKKNRFLFEQFINLLGIDYLILINEGFLYKESWLPDFVIAIVFLHIGFFSSIYYTLKLRLITHKLHDVMINYIIFIQLAFITLCFLHNCQVKTENLAFNFFGAVSMLFLTVIYGFEIRTSYKIHKSYTITNQYNQ